MSIHVLIACGKGIPQSLPAAIKQGLPDFEVTIRDYPDFTEYDQLGACDALVAIPGNRTANQLVIDLLPELPADLPVWFVVDEWDATECLQAIRAGVAGVVGTTEIRLLPGMILRDRLAQRKSGNLIGNAPETSGSAEEFSRCHLFMNTVVNTLPYEIVVRDGDSRILFANEKFANVYGYTADELVGQLDCQMWMDGGRPQEQIDAWLAEDQEILESNESREYIQEIVRPNGNVVHIFNIKQVITLADGSRCILGMYTDVTEAKRTEEELVMARDEAAELAGIRKTAATYAHEINNPLTGILGSVQLILEDGGFDEETTMLLNEVVKASRRIKDVINRMSELDSHSSRPYLDKTEIIDLRDTSADPN